MLDNYASANVAFLHPSYMNVSKVSNIITFRTTFVTSILIYFTCQVRYLHLKKKNATKNVAMWNTIFPYDFGISNGIKELLTEISIPTGFEQYPIRILKL